MMISRAHQGVSDRSIDSCLVTVVGLPPKDPNDDDDDNEQDENGDDEEDQEPTVIREPDEC